MDWLGFESLFKPQANSRIIPYHLDQSFTPPLFSIFSSEPVLLGDRGCHGAYKRVIYCVCVCVCVPVPLSAASSMMLDSCINNLLSESSEGLEMSPTRKVQTMKAKRSHSAVAPPYVSIGLGYIPYTHTHMCTHTKLICKAI